MADLTAIILTKNEQKNLPDCLTSVAGFASRVVVVDSGSDDQTEAIARAFGAEFAYHPFESHARQFNWALDNCDIRTEWVLRIDADERMTDAVKAECEPILKLPRESGVHGISMEAVFYMLGKPLRFGGAKKRKLMIFRNGIGRIEDRLIDEHTVLCEGREVRIRAKFDHYDFKSVGFFADKLNWYATREVLAVLGAQDSDSRLDGRIRRTRKLKSGLYYRFPKFFRAFCAFIFRYVFQLGFLDGRPGLIYHFMYSFMYRFLVDAKLYEAERTSAPAAKLSALDARE
ncbi:MAG: glycosyltransferase family 2 protein [Clostridiales bacterium]|jgi:glycosyltransferase involved in cell wall biosynthesis|nr:glycosyltransferase family 2 protein [Clostridiales bacterium]